MEGYAIALFDKIQRDGSADALGCSRYKGATPQSSGNHDDSSQTFALMVIPERSPFTDHLRCAKIGLRR
jgi:hypothetical protein